MATIKDVAKYADVSVATVSRYLNKKGYLSKEAEKAVAGAIKALNYKPNSVARSLYHKNSKMIGLIIPDISNPFFPELARAVEDVALTYGYTVVTCNTDDDVEKEKRYIEALKQKYVDGLILATNELTADDYKSYQLPLVMLDRSIGDEIPSVRSDNYKGAKQATQLLINRGSQFIAHIRGPKRVQTAEDRYYGFKQAVEENNMAHIVIESGFDLESAKQIMQKTLSEYPMIDGIFASSDVMAAGAMKAAKSLSLNIPNDIQLIGFDGIPLGEMLIPSLSTVAQPIYKMGALSARLLIKQIEKQLVERYHYNLETTLLERETLRSEQNE
ncbi:LacI family DNA-binding transcriptional regulator [Amphibacillus sp. Q70]|uniref:LacI family DNA-binding transcriptional regulator n=1 Tax=Amphibacillus sp. Q70 TaxID=3453416 RepID=UPI003F85BB1F